jgi:uncharacterized protein involved in exopolysaccharide biosynthesis
MSINLQKYASMSQKYASMSQKHTSMSQSMRGDNASLQAKTAFLQEHFSRNTWFYCVFTGFFASKEKKVP